MNWEQCREVMERSVIKTDDMSTEDAYFMATHMPFSNLEVIAGGDERTAPELWDEDRVFHQLILNPDNQHRLIIVRGENGSGKSHLIRYMKARLEQSGEYHPETEQVVFLRRLHNSIRGVMEQLLEQNVIRDPGIAEKMRKFVDSSVAKDADAFRQEIFYAYITAVSSDQSGSVYSPRICGDLAAYLSDPRTKEHLLREGGPISRCFQSITAPQDQVLHDTLIFTREDVADRKVLKAVGHAGNDRAQDFVGTIKSDDDEVEKLVSYLNHFTGHVVRRCADISSESAKAVFEQLRKDLKKQGKTLTLFIEDFTGFTGIDSELITVLSIEHGGDYSRLCRVTAVIGITDGYYNQFRDNFKDRVTHQIMVTGKSYGTKTFLVSMAARYLNAIYLPPEMIARWYQQGAHWKGLPISDFSPPFSWESAPINSKSVTLYPFNRRALEQLYEKMEVKTPRMFLRDVVQAQLKEYFDGKQDEQDGLETPEWNFPRTPRPPVPMGFLPHSSAIDQQKTLPEKDRRRLKTLFAVWGDGSARGERRENGDLFFGGLHAAFLADIGLSAFHGIGEIQDRPGDTASAADDGSDGAGPISASNDSDGAGETVVRPTDSQEDKKRQRMKVERQDRVQDIAAWYDESKPLQYGPDYRRWLRDFLMGSGQQTGAINWQDSGVPASIAAERLHNLEVFQIEGQRESVSEKKAVVTMRRDPESRDALVALVESHYAEGWDFESSAFYQQRLITWLERNRDTILNNVSPNEHHRLPLAEWGLAVQYLKANAYGIPVDVSTPLFAVKSLTSEIGKRGDTEWATEEWRDLIRFIDSSGAEFDHAFKLLKDSAITVMGAVQSFRSDKVPVFRAGELLSAAEKLIGCQWDIENELPKRAEKNFLLSPSSLLKELYQKIRLVTEAEDRKAAQTRRELEDILGGLTEDQLVTILNDVQELCEAFRNHQIPGYGTLRNRYESLVPIEEARRILRVLNAMEQTAGESPVKKFAAYSGNLTGAACAFLRDMRAVERAAETEREKALRILRSDRANSGLEQIAEAARQELSGLYDQAEALEVRIC